METTVDRANSPSTASNTIVSAGEHSAVFVHKSAQFQSNLSRGLGILLFQKQHPDFDIKYILLLSFAFLAHRCTHYSKENSKRGRSVLKTTPLDFGSESKTGNRDRYQNLPCSRMETCANFIDECT